MVFVNRGSQYRPQNTIFLIGTPIILGKPQLFISNLNLTRVQYRGGKMRSQEDPCRLISIATFITIVSMIIINAFLSTIAISTIVTIIARIFVLF